MACSNSVSVARTTGSVWVSQVALSAIGVRGPGVGVRCAMSSKRSFRNVIRPSSSGTGSKRSTATRSWVQPPPSKRADEVDRSVGCEPPRLCRSPRRDRFGFRGGERCEVKECHGSEPMNTSRSPQPTGLGAAGSECLRSFNLPSGRRVPQPAWLRVLVPRRCRPH